MRQQQSPVDSFGCQDRSFLLPAADIVFLSSKLVSNYLDQVDGQTNYISVEIKSTQTIQINKMSSKRDVTEIPSKCLLI